MNGEQLMRSVVAAFETATNTALDSMAMQTAGAVHAALVPKR